MSATAADLKRAFDARLEELERDGLGIETRDDSIRHVNEPLIFDDALLVMATDLPGADWHIRPDNAHALSADLSWFQYELIRIHSKRPGMMCTYSMHVETDRRTQQRSLLMMARWDGESLV